MKRLFTLSTMIMLLSCLIARGQTTAEKDALKHFLETAHQYDGEAAAIPNYKRIVADVEDLDAFWSVENKGVTVNDENRITKISWTSNLYGDFSLSGLTELTFLACYYNNLTSLDISENKELGELKCYDANLSSLDVSANTKLTKLACHNNNITSLDVSKNIALTHLSCSENKNLSSLDVSKNTALIQLDCSDTNLSSLDVSANTKLENLSCEKNNLSSLDISENKELTYLYCYNNNFSSLDVSTNTKLTFLYCSGNHLSTLDISKNTELDDLLCEDNHLPFRDLLAVPAGKTNFNYAPQTLTLEVVPGQEIDMEELGLFITGKESRYLTDGESGEGTKLEKIYRVPSGWSPGKTYTLNMWMENDELPKFKESESLKLSLTVPGSASAYRTVTLTLADGIWCDYQAGQLTVAEGDHLYLQFHPEDPSLTATDMLFLIDDVETPFKVSVDGRSGSYILNPINKDHTIVIAQKEYTVTMPQVDGAVTDPAVGEHKVAYGEPFRFTIDLKDVNDLEDLKVFANDIELSPDALRSDETGHAQSLQQYTIDAITGPIIITIEGINPVGNLQIGTAEVKIATHNGQLTIDNKGQAVDVAVYTITGKNVVLLRGLSGSKSITLPSGIYIVRAGDVTAKIMVND